MDLANLQLDKQKKILIVIFLLFFVYADSAFILKAQKAGIRRAETKISKLNADLENFNRGLENMRQAKNGPQGGERKSSPSTRIVSESRISELLQEISRAANKYDIAITQIRPVRTEEKNKLDPGQGKLTPMLINLEMSGDYHNLGKFIQAVEGSRIFMQVEEVDISTQLPDYMKQKINLVLKTYVTK